jgi:hypothetical protein
LLFGFKLGWRCEVVMRVLDGRVSAVVSVLALVAIVTPMGGQAQSSLPAVPGAYGFGMQTRAAYGGGTTPTIFRVTTLNDAGAGSLRAALEASGPRVVIFEISGTIVLASRLIVRNPFVTVAGQTAPNPGISLRGYALEVATHDVLVQHLRVRTGDIGPLTGSTGLEVWGGARDVVFDHVSVAWANDEGLVTMPSAAAEHNITFWRVLVGESLHYSARASAEAGRTLLTYQGSKKIAMIDSLAVSAHERNPYLKGNTSSYIVNNLFYNWSDGRATIFGDPDGAGPLQSTVANNYYRRGPSTPSSTWMAQARYLKSGSQVYLSGNHRDGANIGEFSVINGDGIDPRVASPPIVVPGHTPRAASLVMDFVLENAGARPRDRDSVDERIVESVRTRSGMIIRSQSEVGGWPSLAVNTRALTLPVNPHNVTSSGYTNLENWLHDFSAVLDNAPATAAPAAPTGVRVVY